MEGVTKKITSQHKRPTNREEKIGRDAMMDKSGHNFQEQNPIN